MISISDYVTIGRMRTARGIPKAIDTHLEYEILIVFPLRQWLSPRAPMLSNTDIVRLVHSRSTV